MGAGLYQYPSVSHRAVDADFERFHYHWVYAAAEKDVVINGETVTMTKDLVLPINVRNNNIQAAPGGNLNNIYLLGNIRAEDISLDISALTEASQRGTLFLWTQGGRENLVSDGAVGLDASNNEYLEHPDDPDLSPANQPFHIGGWFYFLDKGGYRPVISKYGNNTSSREYTLFLFGDNDVMRFIAVDDQGNNSSLDATSFGSIPTNQWIFGDAGWDGSEIFIRLNNGVKDTMGFSGPFNETTIHFGLGEFLEDSRHLAGRLDSTFFYKGGTLTDQEITFLYNSGNGRTYAEVAAHSTLGTKFDGTNGYWWNLDEVSGTRYDATGGGKDLTPVNSPSLAQGVVAGQPSTEQAALSKWEDDSGKSHDPVQSTSVNKGFTWIDTDGKMYVEFGGDDYFEVGGTAQEWEDFLKGDFFICVLVRVDSDGSRFFGIRDPNSTGGVSSFEFRVVSGGKLDIVYSANGNSELLRSSSGFLDGNYHLFSCVVRTNNDFEIWEGDSEITNYDTALSNDPDHSNFNTSLIPYLFARNLDGSPSNFFSGRAKESILCNDLSRFDNIRKELLQKHNLWGSE